MTFNFENQEVLAKFPSTVKIDLSKNTKLFFELISIYFGSVSFFKMLSSLVKDIKELDLTDVRNSVSIVTQETILFNESIFNNIKYGNLKATDEEISLVAKNAGVSSFSEELDQKLDTVIGENGVKLSDLVLLYL